MNIPYFYFLLLCLEFSLLTDLFLDFLDPSPLLSAFKGAGGLSSATFWFTADATQLIGLQITSTDGWITAANVTSMNPQVPPASIFANIPSPCASGTQ